MMRRCAGFNTDEAWHQLLEECQDITSLQLAPDDHLAYRVDTVDLKNRLRDVETDRRDPLHAALLRIVVTPAATTSMALTCRWRSRPQHHNRTCRVWMSLRSVGKPARRSAGKGDATEGVLRAVEFTRAARDFPGRIPLPSRRHSSAGAFPW